MFKDLRPTIYMLVRFILIYLILVAVYQFYLNYFSGTGLDPYSSMITKQIKDIQNFIGYPTLLYEDLKKEQIYFYVKNDYRTKMVEGCNAISVMILYVAFIFAFYNGVRTFVFVLVSLVLLYIMNLLRIVGLNIVMTDHHEFGKFAHDFIFPAIIYGTVVLLWLIWMKYFLITEK